MISSSSTWTPSPTPHSHPLWTKLRNADPLPSSPFLLSSLANLKLSPGYRTVSRNIKRELCKKRAPCQRKHSQNHKAACRQGSRANWLSTRLGARDPWQRPAPFSSVSFQNGGEKMFFSATVLMWHYLNQGTCDNDVSHYCILYSLVSALPDNLLQSLLTTIPGGLYPL